MKSWMEQGMTDQRAVVLLSGGLDSSTVLAMAQAQGFLAHALTVHYGQRHEFEIDTATRAGKAMGVAEHQFMEVDLRGIGQSALTDNIAVPVDRTAEEMNSAIPVTYVPARNTVLLSCALAYAESIGAFDIFVGVNALDYAGYPDCRPEYIAAFEQMANVATKQALESDRRIRIHAPLIRFTKAEIIRKGIELGVDYALSSTCYAPSVEGHACGHCDACLLRLEGFAEVGVPDPVAYQIAGTQ
jgi:7-cyano-7-deazaguanine synthase